MTFAGILKSNACNWRTRDKYASATATRSMSHGSICRLRTRSMRNSFQVGWMTTDSKSIATTPPDGFAAANHSYAQVV